MSKIRLDLKLSEVELTGEARSPEIGELYLYGTFVHECDRSLRGTRVIVRERERPPGRVVKHVDLFPDLPPAQLPYEEPKPRYNT